MDAVKGIIERREQGETLSSIAEDHDVSPGSVSRIHDRWIE
ncbi:helix-turn-helix domain-containing protein [Natrarchaeobius chitinivorans]|uniref:Helix-turn-helix domain-containing protein n=1 Tax=Natrarchaeobius chitinivorans TaxID=1679083 RepID=A0A3N6LTJ4_NATCH|nr:helix-turn-helix domain-containing protein [Natrarchaeobius chitinivorans]RQG90754.1 helix-turn-helix domain-containing protein [Natrarchaeobius chitinivorans]